MSVYRPRPPREVPSARGCDGHSPGPPPTAPAGPKATVRAPAESGRVDPTKAQRRLECAHQNGVVRTKPRLRAPAARAPAAVVSPSRRTAVPARPYATRPRAFSSGASLASVILSDSPGSFTPRCPNQRLDAAALEVDHPDQHRLEWHPPRDQGPDPVDRLFDLQVPPHLAPHIQEKFSVYIHSQSTHPWPRVSVRFVL